MRRCGCIYVVVLALGWFCADARAAAGTSLTWNTNQNVVSADIQSLPVARLLGGIARHTGWQIFLEPNVSHTVSTKFKELSSGQALRMLLGDLNFALVPQTNGPTHLYVFRTNMGNATQMIRPEDLVSKVSHSGKIPNELVVTMKPGAKIEGLDCVQDAKSSLARSRPSIRIASNSKDEAAAKSAVNCLSQKIRMWLPWNRISRWSN